MSSARSWKLFQEPLSSMPRETCRCTRRKSSIKASRAGWLRKLWYAKESSRHHFRKRRNRSWNLLITTWSMKYSNQQLTRAMSNQRWLPVSQSNSFSRMMLLYLISRQNFLVGIWLGRSISLETLHPSLVMTYRTTGMYKSFMTKTKSIISFTRCSTRRSHFLFQMSLFRSYLNNFSLVHPC